MNWLSDRAGAVLRGIIRPLTRRWSCGSRGMTLMELLVVLAIIAIIAVVAVPQVLSYLSRSRIQAADIQVDQLSTILDMYRFDVGRYPTTAEGLDALVNPPPGVDRWAGPYLRKPESLIDPWGNPYGYRAPGDHGDFDLWSYGADGTSGGEGENADITNW
jgi:general secretion pathway protein G